MAFKSNLMRMMENVASAVDAAADNVDQVMERASEGIDNIMADSDDSSDDNASQQPYSLDADEVMIDSLDDATWVSFDEEFLDELVLTSKRLICVWKENNGLFKPATAKVHAFRLEDVKTLRDEPAVQRVKHEGCHCLQIQFLDSVEYFSFDESPKKLSDQWANEIRQAWHDLQSADGAVSNGRPTAQDANEFNAGTTPDDAGCASDDSTLPYSLMLERSFPRGTVHTKTEFFVLDDLGRKRYSIECVNYEKASKDNHASLRDSAGKELGSISTKERMKGQSDDEYLINLKGRRTQYHLRVAYLWERPKGNRFSNVYLLKPNKWLVILSIKEQFESIKASFRGEDVRAPMCIWDKDELVVRITRRVSERENYCYEIETRNEDVLLLAMMIAIATSGVLDHSEVR